MKAKWFFILFALVGLVGSMTPVGAVEAPLRTLSPVHPIIIADLRVAYIETRTCQCPDKLALVDAMLIDQKLAIKVVNEGPGDSDVKLDVTYYDYRVGHLVTVTRNIAGLKGSGVWSGREQVVFINGPFLLKKSAGIKAVISSTSGARDSNPRNNTVTIRDCATVVE